MKRFFKKVGQWFKSAFGVGPNTVDEVVADLAGVQVALVALSKAKEEQSQQLNSRAAQLYIEAKDARFESERATSISENIGRLLGHQPVDRE